MCFAVYLGVLAVIALVPRPDECDGDGSPDCGALTISRFGWTRDGFDNPSYGYAGGLVLELQADGGWATWVTPADGGSPYMVPIGLPPRQLVNVVDGGWLAETPLRNGGVLRLPASTPPGY